jgi:phosphate transport system substrate-binding protein
LVRRTRNITVLAAAGVLAIGVAACGSDDNNSGGGDLSGKISLDGSSTVLPFAQAAAELFNQDNPNVKITVGSSGTGGGFEKFCAGETDISDASRPIKPEEADACKKKGVTYQQVQVANDGIAIVTNKSLKIDCMTVAQLKKLWDKGSTVKTYNQIDPSFPNTPVKLFGPGTDSGTFDFFTDKINGEEDRSRSDYSPSEDDNVTLQGVEGSEGGLGYFGFSYYEGAKDKVNLVKVGETASDCIAPSTQTIQGGTYKPLSRPLFMYPSEKALAEKQVSGFMDFVIKNQAEIAKASQIVPMTPAQLSAAQAALKKGESAAG